MQFTLSLSKGGEYSERRITLLWVEVTLVIDWSVMWENESKNDFSCIFGYFANEWNFTTTLQGI